MANIVVYIIFPLVLSLSIAISAAAFVCCKKWRTAYDKLKLKYQETYSDNIRYQHEIYKLTYITPSVSDTKKG